MSDINDSLSESEDEFETDKHGFKKYMANKSFGNKY